MSNINQCATCALAHQCEAGQIRPQIVRGDCEGDECLAWEPIERRNNGGDSDDD